MVKSDMPFNSLHRHGLLGLPAACLYRRLKCRRGDAGACEMHEPHVKHCDCAGELILGRRMACGMASTLHTTMARASSLFAPEGRSEGIEQRIVLLRRRQTHSYARRVREGLSTTACGDVSRPARLEAPTSAWYANLALFSSNFFPIDIPSAS